MSNSTSLTLRPSSWDDGGCPISHLTIEYRPRSNGNAGSHSQWIVVSRNLSPDEGPMTLHDLRPETWYNVRVTATNDAGSTDAEFTVRTVPNSHGELGGSLKEPFCIIQGLAYNLAYGHLNSDSGADGARSKLRGSRSGGASDRHRPCRSGRSANLRSPSVLLQKQGFRISLLQASGHVRYVRADGLPFHGRNQGQSFEFTSQGHCGTARQTHELDASRLTHPRIRCLIPRVLSSWRS